jgi:hypothetical protein
MIKTCIISELIGVKVHGIVKVEDSIITYRYNALGEVRTASVNIYELEHKCKQYLRDNEYLYVSHVNGYAYMWRWGKLYSFDNKHEYDSIFALTEIAYELQNKKGL